MKKNIFDTSLSTTIKLSLRRTLVLQQSLQQLLQQPAQSEAKGYVILFSRPHPLIPLQKRGTVRHCKSKLNNYHINLSLLLCMNQRRRFILKRFYCWNLRTPLRGVGGLFLSVVAPLRLCVKPFLFLIISMSLYQSTSAQTWIWYPGDYEIWL